MKMKLVIVFIAVLGLIPSSQAKSIYNQINPEGQDNVFQSVRNIFNGVVDTETKRLFKRGLDDVNKKLIVNTTDKDDEGFIESYSESIGELKVLDQKIGENDSNLATPYSKVDDRDSEAEVDIKVTEIYIEAVEPSTEMAPTEVQVDDSDVQVVESDIRVNESESKVIEYDDIDANATEFQNYTDDDDQQDSIFWREFKKYGSHCSVDSLLTECVCGGNVSDKRLYIPDCSNEEFHDMLKNCRPCNDPCWKFVNCLTCGEYYCETCPLLASGPYCDIFQYRRKPPPRVTITILKGNNVSQENLYRRKEVKETCATAGTEKMFKAIEALVIVSLMTFVLLIHYDMI